jgi:hypothetical protein
MILFKSKTAYDEYYHIDEYTLTFKVVKKIDKNNTNEQHYKFKDETSRRLRINELIDDGYTEIFDN